MDKLLNNEYALAVIVLTAVVFANETAKPSKDVQELLQHNWTRFVLYFFVAYLANRDFGVSLVLAGVFTYAYREMDRERYTPPQLHYANLPKTHTQLQADMYKNPMPGQDIWDSVDEQKSAPSSMGEVTHFRKELNTLFDYADLNANDSLSRYEFRDMYNKRLSGHLHSK